MNKDWSGDMIQNESGESRKNISAELALGIIMRQPVKVYGLACDMHTDLHREVSRA